MLFSSTTFLFAFLPIVLITYYIVPRITRNLVLFIFSLVFYAWGEPVYIVLMIASTIVAYITGLLADKQRKSAKKYTPLIAMIGAVVWNIGLLLFFKYTDFFIGAANSIFGTQIKTLGLALPIGISFYSFQTLSYVIDVYKGEVRSQKNFLDLATYVALFPQLIAGPIVRYIDVAEQLKKRNESIEHFAQGVWRFSIGLGKMFGFDFLENFNYPYISTSITDFWRRWHMSLSSWFRDYVYIPLGGNRKGKARQCLNIMIVWFLTGFWHGANWNFMLWGVYFGVILLCEKLFLGKALKKIPAFFQHLYALLFIVIGWGIFSYEDFGKLTQNFKNMFGAGGLPLINHQTVFWLAQYAVTIVILVIASTQLPKKLCLKLQIKCPEICGCILQPLFALTLLAVSTAYLAGNSFNPFLYFRF